MEKIRLLSLSCLIFLLTGGCRPSAVSTPTATETPFPTRQAGMDLAYAYPLPSTLSAGADTIYPAPASLTRTPSSSPTKKPTFPPTLTLTPVLPTPIPGQEPEPAIKIVPADLVAGNSVLHDLILIEAKLSFPFDYSKYSALFEDLLDTPETKDNGFDRVLWAVSPDGKRMGRLTPLGKDTLLFIPSSGARKPLVVEYGVHFNSPDLISVSLPEECYDAPLTAFDPSHDPNKCQYFKFSPDGRYLSYTFNEGSCRRIMNIQEVSTGKVIYQDEVNGGIPEFLPDDRAFFTIGHCEGGSTLMVDLKTGQVETAGGYAWEYQWNTTHTAFLVQISPYQGFTGRSFWGYDTKTERLFSIPVTEHTLDSPAVWTPYGSRILYVHRDFSAVQNGSFLPKGTSQIMRLDPASGITEVVLSDPGYDFDLCLLSQSLICPQKHPDWFEVKRYPVPADPDERARYSKAVIECLETGSCPPEPEMMALNWRTGELLPWEQSPTAAPTSTPAGPRQRGESNYPLPPDPGQKPFYASPSGEYAFYIGADGISLWRVIGNNPPVLWVHAGDYFYYLP